LAPPKPHRPIRTLRNHIDQIDVQALIAGIGRPTISIVALNASAGSQPDIAVAVLEKIRYSSDQSAFLIERSPIALCQYLISSTNLQRADTKRRCNTQDQGQ